MNEKLKKNRKAIVVRTENAFAHKSTRYIDRWVYFFVFDVDIFE